MHDSTFYVHVWYNKHIKYEEYLLFNKLLTSDVPIL